MSKYDALAAFLADVPADQTEVHLSFEEVDRMIGGLPASAREHRPWWGNSSSVQGSAWTRAGWHVGKVELGLSRVTFIRRASRVSRPARNLAALLETAVPSPRVPAEDAAVETVSLGVTFTWRRLGHAALDGAGKLMVPGSPPATPGLYRFTTLRSATKTDIHIGETDDLQRRLTMSYRNPGPGQPTTVWVNDFLVASLSEGFDVAVDIVTEVSLEVAGEDVGPLDLGRKSGRLLAESAARVLAERSGEAEVVNLG